MDSETALKKNQFCVLPVCLNKLHAQSCTFLAHFFRPDAGLNLADVCFSKVQHAES